MDCLGDQCSHICSGGGVPRMNKKIPVSLPVDFKGIKGASTGVNELKEGSVVEFFTDVEGNWMYFRQFVKMSEILYWDEDEDWGTWGPGRLKIKDHGVLVFGGDTVDKGPGDIRIVKHLLHLKKDHWNQVFLVIGNRDINKLRFYAELDKGEDATLFEKHGGAYWITNPAQNKKYDAYLEEQTPKLENNHVSTLKWMLDCNMGCQVTTFRNRRRELALTGCRATSDDVVYSFRSSVDPRSGDPWMLDYLRVAQLVVLLGDIIFIHAGLNEANLGWVPGEATRRANVKDWVTGLNKWKDDQLKDFIDRPAWREENGGHFGSRRRGGDLLIDYGVPNGVGGRSVVYCNPFNNGNPKIYDTGVEDFLRDSGVTRVISGHQPHGESPAVVRHVRTGLLAIMSDTSYSNPKASKAENAANMRGDVCCIVRMDKNTVTLEGVLQDGTPHKCTVPAGLNVREFGFVSHDGYFVKVKREKAHIDLYLDGDLSGEISKLDIDKQKRTFAIGENAGVFGEKEDVEKVVKLRDALFVPIENAPNDMESLKNEMVGRQLRDGSWVKTVTKQGEVVTALGVGFSVAVRRIHVLHARLLLKPEYSTASTRDITDITGEMQKFVYTHQLAPPAEASEGDLTRTASGGNHGMTIDAREFHRMETLIFDGQGTLWSIQGKALDATPDGDSKIIAKVNQFISDVTKKVIFASNDSTLSRKQVLRKLRDGMKLNVGRVPYDEELTEARETKLANEHIINAGFTCAWYLKKSGIKRPLVFCSQKGLLDELESMEITDYFATIDKNGVPLKEFNEPMDSQRVQDLVQRIGKIDAIVVGWDMLFSALKAAVAASYLKWSQEKPIDGQSIRLVVCSRDLSGVKGVTPPDFQPSNIEAGFWGTSKITALGNGSMGHSICLCAGLPPNYGIDCGKPSFIFSEALEDEYKVDLSKAVVIGDTLETDMELANHHGMSSVLVLSGLTSQKLLERTTDVTRLPTWVVQSVADIPCYAKTEVSAALSTKLSGLLSQSEVSHGVSRVVLTGPPELST